MKTVSKSTLLRFHLRVDQPGHYIKQKAYNIFTINVLLFHSLTAFETILVAYKTGRIWI